MKRAVLSLTLLLSFAVAANAAPIFAAFPGPGNAGVVGSGNAGVDGGRTNTYTFATPGAGYTDLWFGYYDIFLPLVSGGVGAQQLVTGAPTITGNQAIWAGNQQWQINMAVGPDLFRNVRFRMETFDLGNVALNLVPASGPGVVGSAGAVLPLGVSGGFKVNFGFEVFDGAIWRGVDTYFNSIGANEVCDGPCVIRNATGAFWYENNAAVPEPASLALLGAGLAFGARRLRRRSL